LSTQQLHAEALYYPFHLCSEETLKRLLERYERVHFRDYMALQLTPTAGTTAYADRMGNFHPDLVKAERIVQGHGVSGPLDRTMEAAVNRDLHDPVWRSVFHEALQSDRRFQRGLLDLSHGIRIGGRVVPGAAALLELMQDARKVRPYSVQVVRTMSADASSWPDPYDFEYGWALIKTAASLQHTVRLCQLHRLDAATDSQSHYRLLQQECERDRVTITNVRVGPSRLEPDTATLA
jgi:hypothetical protein